MFFTLLFLGASLVLGQGNSTSTPWAYNHTILQVSGAFTVLQGACSTDETGRCVYSPHYPKTYDGSDCEMEVQAGILNARVFDTEMDYDRLIVGGGEYSGTSGPVNLEVGEGDKIHWVTFDDAVKHDGWELCWLNSTSLTTTTATEQCPGILNFMDNSVQNNGTTTEFQVLSGQCTLSDGGRCVRSPNYPNAYNNEDCCTIFSPAGYLVATSFSVESGWDQLYVANAAYTGWSLPIIEIGEGGNIAWSTDHSVVSDGWEICVDALPTTSSRTPVDAITVLVPGCNVSGNCVTSPNFPSSYEDNERCAFLVPEGFIYASAFETEEHFDYLYIGGDKYDGTWGPWGHAVSSGEEVVWESDYSIVRNGWRICVEAENVAPATTTGPVTTELTALSGECISTSTSCIASPNYPSAYGNDESCTIATPAGFIPATTFRTESHFDYLYVGGFGYDGDSGPHNVVVTQGDVIEWESDFSVKSAGWELCFHENELSTTSAPPLSTLSVLSGNCIPTSEFCVASPNYPSNYTAAESCTIQTPSGTVSSRNFITEEFFDFLVIGSQFFDGTNGPDGVGVAQGDLIQWEPDFSVQLGGWEICVNTTMTQTVSRDISVIGHCTVTDSCFASPNFPSFYPVDSHCTIRTPAGYLYSSSFETESYYDWFGVDDLSFSGAQGPWGLEVSGETDMVWYADGSVEGKGWEICWHESQQATTTELTLVSGSCVVLGNCVTSPNYPSSYNNSDDCTVVSPAGVLYSSHFHTEASWDFLYVVGHAYDGHDGPQGVEVPDGATISWSSDGSVIAKGWEICLWPTDEAENMTAEDTMTTTTGAEDTTLTTTTAQDTINETTGAEDTTLATTTAQDTVTATTIAEDTTTATPSAILVLGSFSFSMDSAGQVRLCNSTTEAKQAVMDGANAVSTFSITIEQVTSVTVSPCPSRRLAAKRALQDVDVSLDFEISFEDSASATLSSEEINGDASSFGDAMATSLDDSLGITVSNVQVEVTQTTVTVPDDTDGVAGAATNMLAIVVIVLSSFFRVADA